MRQDNRDAPLPKEFTWSFWQAVAQEIGAYSLNMILLKAGLEKFVERETSLPRREPLSAEEFGLFQRALGEYYGRGARGLLTRAGAGAWRLTQKKLPLGRKLLIGVLHLLPPALSARLVLRNLAVLLHYPGDWAAVKPAGREYSYKAFFGLGCAEQAANEPVCWTMVGLLREALESVTRRTYEVEEVACRAAGAETCMFRIRQL